MSEGHHSPLAQFEVKPLIPLHIGEYDISFTNASLWMLLAVIGILLFLSAAARKPRLVPGRMQGLAEMLMDLTGGTLKDIVGKEGMKYFPQIFTLFMFILAANLLGMLPGSFTVTSHIIVTFALAACVFIGCTMLAIIKHGPAKFLHYFLPHGTPLWMAPLIYPIEVLSYTARPVSLSIRLAANMMAGHTLLKVIASFIFLLGLAGIAPLALLVILTGFEIGVAILHAYIFTILTCVYLHDAVHLH